MLFKCIYFEKIISSSKCEVVIFRALATDGVLARYCIVGMQGSFGEFGRVWGQSLPLFWCTYYSCLVLVLPLYYSNMATRKGDWESNSHALFKLTNKTSNEAVLQPTHLYLKRTIPLLNRGLTLSDVWFKICMNFNKLYECHVPDEDPLTWTLIHWRYM